MRRRDIIGRPILAQDSGRYLGEVREVVVDLANTSVLGVVVLRGRWFQTVWFLPFEDIASCGDGALLVESEDALIARSDYDQRASADGRLVGKRILDATGRDVGTLDDIFFDPRTRQVTGYQVSGGLIDDLIDGKWALPAVALTVGSDALLIGAADAVDRTGDDPYDASTKEID